MPLKKRKETSSFPFPRYAGNFKLGGERGTILKKLCPKEESCFQLLMKDPLRPFIPSYKGNVTSDDGESNGLINIL
jgi:hypothetical protein